MAESKFKQLQEDVCYKEPEEIPEPDKICPTCIPNESYTPPNWRLTKAPYLDESKCLYMIKVDINIDGDIYYAANGVEFPKLPNLFMKKISDSPYTHNTLLKSYIRPAVRKALRFYGKLETDEIVCAMPPQNPGEICQGIHGVDYEEFITQSTQQTDEPVPNYVETYTIAIENLLNITKIKNPDALELFARVEDYDYLTNARILSVLIGIPAYKLDSIPNAPDLGSVNTSTNKIVIKPHEFMIDMLKFKSAMQTYATYQAFFKQQENGSVYFEQTGDPFYIRFFSDAGGRIDKFLERFEALLNNNDFSVRGFLDSGLDVPNIAQEIEISFDKSNETKPFAIQNVRARKQNCPYVECKVGLDSFKDYSQKDQTMLGYFASMKKISRALSSNKTPPWIDFVVANTFPQLAVNYGSSGNFEDTCVNNAVQDLEDFILKQTVDAFKAMEYRYNQNRCKKPEDIRDFNKTLTTFLVESGSEQAFNDFTNAFAERARQLDALPNQILNIPKNIGETFSNAGSSIRDFISNLNPCDIKAGMTASMKCIMASLSAEEAYRAIIKQIISSAGEEALETLLQSLPANQQQKIREEVEKQFGDMPFPWEPGWESGDLGGAVDRQARENIQDKEQKAKTADENSASIEKQIEEIDKKIASARTRYFDDLRQREEKLGNELISLEVLPARISIVQVDIELTENNLTTSLEVLPETSERVRELRQRLSTKQQELRDLQFQLARLPVVESELKGIIEILATEDDVFGNTEANRAIIQEQTKLEKEREKLIKKATKEDKVVDDLAEYQNFSSLSEEEQAEMVEKQKEKTFLVKTTPEDKIKEGTLGKALGNVQKALTQAYIDEIMKTATIGDLQRAIENIPGSDLLGTIISQFKCPGGATIYPPIDSFLSTLTLDPCKGTSPKLSLPTIPDIPLSWNWLEVLGEAFMFSLKQIISATLVALMRKAAELLNTDLCKLSGNLLRGAADGGLEGVISELICDDPRPGDTQDKVNQKVLEAGGARKRNPEDYKAVASVLSVAATQREIKAAMVCRADEEFLNNMSSIVSAAVPSFADLFSDSQSVANYFCQMGNLLTQEQRNTINDQLNSPFDDDFPVETSICLTKEQKDAWDQERAAAFQDPDLGREFVNKQNEKALNDLSDAADLLLNGVNLDDALAKAFNPKDPDCKTNAGVIPGFQDLPQNKQKSILTATEGIFKRLEKAFLDDTVEGNFFEITDPPGILLSILADTKNRGIDFHLAVKNNPILNFLFGGFIGGIPETVGIRLKNQIDEISDDYAIRPQVSQPAFTLTFSNGKEGNKAFTESITLEDNTLDDSIRIEDQFQNTTVSYNLDVPEEFSVTTEEIQTVDSSRAAMFKKLLERNWSKFDDAQINEDDVVNIYQDINNTIYNDFTKTLVYRREGEMSEGFLYGKEGTEIVEDLDLVYVGPNGEEPYGDFFTEEDKVLGKSKTNNPRVHFLDPAKYGGTYTKPQIYIEEADHKGWLNFSKIIVPDPTGCDPKNSNFLMLDSIMKDIENNKGKIKNHELIQYDPECTTELPFDKIANSDTLATLEGIVKATIRVYLTEFMIQSYPIFSNIDLTDRNFDNTLTEYIADFMIRGIKDQRAVFASTYEGYTYLLLFLEQVVQIVHRKVRDARMDSNEEIERILEICNTVQENYIAINTGDLNHIKLWEGVYARAVEATSPINIQWSEDVEAKIDIIKKGISILSGEADEGFDFLSFLQGVTFDLTTISLENARFASKVATIDSVYLEIKKLLKYLVAEEFETYKTKLRDELSPRPHIYDSSKFFIGGSNILFGKNIDAGTFDTELPIGGGVGNFPYGDILECAKSDMKHPLDGTTLTTEDINKLSQEGGFYLEKYLMITPKEGFDLPDHIKGITSISELKAFMNNYAFQFDQTKNVSDYFGNAVLNENETEYEGTIGIKYGVRLCYVPKVGFAPISNSSENRAMASESRSYILNLSTLDGKVSQYTFPIAYYEQDIIDVTIKEFLESNSNLNQDLKCYVDKLCETKEFRHLMDNVITITKIPSIMMIYSFNFFLSSLGDPSERVQDDQQPMSPDDIGKMMNDSKAEARKLFVSFYKNNDRHPPNEEESVDYVSQLQKQAVAKLSFIDFSPFSFNIQRRLRKDNPLDKNGEECKNNFGKLFKIGGTS